MNAADNAFILIFKLLSLYFLAVSLFCLCRRKKPAASAGQRRFAILIAARNEESCIAGLIESLQAQRYPRELFDIWVLPNNCTDHTVEAAQRAGARIMEMPSSVRSKGAALQYAADTLLRGQQHYDAFCVFDADNEAHVALSHPEVSVKFIREGKLQYVTPGDGQLRGAAYAVLGREFSRDLIELENQEGVYHIAGLITPPKSCRASRSMQQFYNNGRYVRNRTMMAGIEMVF